MTLDRQRRTRCVLVVLAGVVALLALVKVFLADVYRVNSGSMRPTLFGGEEARAEDRRELSEWVLVDYERSPRLQRFDLIVLEGERRTEPLVKRVAGLPREEVAIVGGDLLVDGRRLAPDAARPAPVLLFDDALLPLREYFHVSEPRWTEEAGFWRVTSAPGEAALPDTLMRFGPDLTDGYLRSDGAFVPGLLQVNDGVLALEARVAEAQGRIVLELVEEGDDFRAELDLGGVEPRLRLLRKNAAIARARRAATGSPWAILLDEPIDFALDQWHAVRFANVDNHLHVRIDGLEFGCSYENNAPAEGPRSTETPRSIGTRVSFGADGATVDYRRVRVYRDLFWTGTGDHATRSPYVLGPDELFLLGDNSTYSTDSRTFGAVPLREIRGRPIAVVWPPERARRLSGTD
ncbi:MAG: S26 family signal peptidase [Planctomycetota bacterium]